MRLVPCVSTLLLLGIIACSDATPIKDATIRGNSPPNIVLIYMDDMGFGDLSIQGHPTINTPNLDHLAREGQLWTNFYTASSVCSPSRGALLTGRYPIRIGLGAERHRVFFPGSIGGLPTEEVTIAEVLKQAGYATAAIGKWHLGHLPEYLPTNQGFDYYYGIPYSNDMDAVKWSLETFFAPPDINMWKVPLMENDSIIERPANQHTITRRYTEKAISFMEAHQEEPFFLYLPHSMVHTPLFAADTFLGTSSRGLYGDVMAEVDWSVGQIIKSLETMDLAEHTLVIFSSDNGPWLMMREHGGSAGLLRDGKGTTWEGGMRVPGIFYMPGTVQPGRITDIGSTLDVLPTVAAFAGADLPEDRQLDGFDLSPVLRSRDPGPRDHMLFYRKREIFAARMGPFKAHFTTATCYKADNQRVDHERPLLFHLEHDPGEYYDHAAEHPQVLEAINELIAQHRAELEAPPSEMDRYAVHSPAD